MHDFDHLTYEEKLQAAVYAVRTSGTGDEPKLSVRKAAERYQVKKATLQDRLKGKLPRVKSQKKNQLLNDDQVKTDYSPTRPRVSNASSTNQSPSRLPFEPQESVFADWINLLGVLGQPLDYDTIAPYVEDLAGRRPGRGWLRRFLKRNKHRIQYCRTSSLDPKRARAFNYPVIKDFFEKFKAVLEEYKIPWENVYNMDEKGCQLGGGRKGRRKKYLFGRNSKARYTVRDANLELVTVIECVSADGFALQPYIIFKGQRLSEEWFKAELAELASHIGKSENGWTDNIHCGEWFGGSFLPQAQKRNKTNGWILLLCDGHGSHCAAQLLLLARTHNVLIFRLPPHCTHKIQPLDVGILGPLQTAYTNQVDAFVRAKGHGIQKKDFITLYLRARLQSFSPALILKAWEHCGIRPFNPNIFTDADFGPSKGYSTIASSYLPSSFPPLPATSDDNADDSDLESAGVESHHSTGRYLDVLDSDADPNSDPESGSDDERALRTHTRSSDHPPPDNSQRPRSPSPDIPIPPLITPSLSKASLLRIALGQQKMLSQNSEKLSEMESRVTKAEAHAVFVGRQYTQLQTERAQKKTTRTTAASLDPHARVLNTDEAIEVINQQQAIEDANNELKAPRLVLAEEHSGRLAMYKEAAAMGVVFGVKWRENEKKRRKKEREAAKAAKEAEKEAEKMIAKAQKAALKAAKDAQALVEKQAKAAEKRAEAQRKREAKQAETARKKLAAEAAKEAKKLADVGKSGPRKKRTSSGRAGGRQKRRKVSEELASSDKENEDETHFNDDSNSSPPTPTASPKRPRPRPRPRFNPSTSQGVASGADGALMDVQNPHTAPPPSSASSDSYSEPDWE